MNIAIKILGGTVGLGVTTLGVVRGSPLAIFIGAFVLISLYFISRTKKQELNANQPINLDGFSIDLLSSAEITRPFTVIKIVSGKSTDNYELAIALMKKEALELDANAIIDVTKDNISNITTSTGLDALADSVVYKSRGIETKITYYAHGSAIKYLSEVEEIIKNWNEDEYYNKMLTLKKLFDSNLIEEEEFDTKISALKRKKEIYDRNTVL